MSVAAEATALENSALMLLQAAMRRLRIPDDFSGKLSFSFSNLSICALTASFVCSSSVISGISAVISVR